jgi:hypothetical protein
MKLVSSILLALLLTLTSSAARAQDAAAQAEARVLFDEGAKLLADGKAQEACPKLEASLRRYPGLGTHGKLAECYEAVGRIASAWALYRKVIALAVERGDTGRERVARERADKLAPRLAYLQIDVPPQSRVTGLEVRAGGTLVEEAVFGTRLARDPGGINVEATAPGYLPFRSEVRIEEAKTASVTVTLTRDPNPTPAPTAAPVSTKSDERSWQMPLGVATLGIGAACMIAGAALAVVAKNTWDGAFEAGCDEATLSCNQAGFDETEKARTLADASTGLVIAGAVLAAAGVTLWITAPGYPGDVAVQRGPFGVGVRF